MKKILFVLVVSCLLVSGCTRKSVIIDREPVENYESQQVENSSEAVVQNNESENKETAVEQIVSSEPEVEYSLLKIEKFDFDKNNVNLLAFKGQMSSKYNMNLDDVYDYFGNFYVLGWSKEGYVAFLSDRVMDGAGIERVSFYVQDIVSDKIVYSDVLDFEDSLNSPFPGEYLKQKKTEINSKLEEYKILDVRPELKPLPYSYENYTFDFSVKLTEVRVDYDIISVQNYTITAERDDGTEKKSKEIVTKKEERAENVKICGVFESPFEKRLLLVYAQEEYTFEGCELFPKTAGCAVLKGF